MYTQKQQEGKRISGYDRTNLLEDFLKPRQLPPLWTSSNTLQPKTLSNLKPYGNWLGLKVEGGLWKLLLLSRVCDSRGCAIGGKESRKNVGGGGNWKQIRIQTTIP